MRAVVVRDVRAAVADASRRAVTPLGLERDVARQLARVIPFDLWCGLTTDPGTGHPTGGYHDEGLPAHHLSRLLEIENDAQPDFVSLRTLSAAPTAARTLGDATGGDLPRSARFRDVLAPSGIGHEVRVALRGGGCTWGAMILMRGSDDTDFSAAETDLLHSLAPTVAEGLRRTAVLGGSRPASDDGPGLVLCTVADELRIDHATETARARLAEIADGLVAGLPYSVAALVHSAGHQSPAQGPRRARIRTRTGDWLTVHAERLGPTLVSVIIEPTRQHEIADLLADAYRLSPREREVAALAARGLTNAAIGAALFLSPYTVGDHLKRVFTKTGVSSRTELAATLLLERTGRPA